MKGMAYQHEEQVLSVVSGPDRLLDSKILFFVHDMVFDITNSTLTSGLEIEFLDT